MHYKYTTYIEVETRYLLITRSPSKLTLKMKNSRMMFRNHEEAVVFLNELKEKLKKNNYAITDQDRLSFRVHHQSALLSGLPITKTMNSKSIVKAMKA